MRLSSFLLAAGLSSSALAVDASLDPWEIDPSCNGFENDIKDALTQSIDLAEAARTSLEFLLAKMPDRNSDPDGAVKWARISSAANSIFGLMPNYKGHDAETKKYIEDLRGLLDSSQIMQFADIEETSTPRRPTLCPHLRTTPPKASAQFSPRNPTPSP